MAKYNISADHYKLLYRFRCCIDQLFSEASNEEEYTFKNAIKLAQTKLRKEQT